MMNAQELIDELNGQGITLLWDGGSLYWDAPFEYVPPDEIVELVKKNKDEIARRINGPVFEERLSGTNIVNLIGGDCLGAMKRYPDNLVDVIVTDPPYGLEFMKKDWDKAVPSVEIWKECLRVLKPGGFAFIMSSPRQDVLARMTVNLQEAGFNTGFTSLYWTYASGFPKSQNISKAIDKKADSEPKEAFVGAYGGYQPKPAVEVILIVQKPLSKKTYADQALVNGKGVTWLEDCRIPFADDSDKAVYDYNRRGPSERLKQDWESPYEGGWEKPETGKTPQGRFPANLLISDDVLDDAHTHAKGYSRMFSIDAWFNQQIANGLNISDLKESDQKVLPFLIVPKASTAEKNWGCENLKPQQVDKSRDDPNAIDCNNPRNRGEKQKKNFHPTVKPILLVSYLITMGSREGDIVLDPFCGSGTTCLAARLLKRPSIGIEKDPDYFKIAAARMRALNLLSHIGQEQRKTSGTKNAEK